MTGTEAAFSVKNGFGEIVSDEDTLTLKMNPHVSKESPNYQFLIPLEINFSKKNKDSVLRIEIEARVDGNAWSPTAQTFRGQIISTVEDKKRTERTGINLFSNLHDLHSPNNSTSMSVERDQWEEGKNPKIEFITTTDKGVIEFGLLGIFSDDGRGPSPYLLDPDTYLKINLLEKIGTSSKIIRSFKIMFDEKEGLTEFDFIEEHLIKRYQSRSHAIEGDGYALHPKQLLTVELLDQLLSPEVIDALGGKIDLGYIGLDTGENVISVLRHLKRKKLIPYIETLTIIFYPDWDNDYRKILTQHIEQSQIENIKWVNAKKGVDDEGKEVRVDIMISTYVAVWAHNEYQMESGETEEYFSAAWKNCKEQALLLSIDPIESSKIARSREFAGRCDVDEYYQNEGFAEDESIRIKGINPTCVAKVWKKGEWKSEDVPFRGAPEAPKRRFIQVLGSIGDLIDCAGYPTHSVPLVKANVLKHEDTKLINPEQGSSQNPSVGVLETEGDSKMAGNRVFLNKSTASPLDSIPTSPIYPCGTEFVELEFAVNKADREQLATSFSRFENTMGPLFESGFLEIPLSIYSPYPVVVLGEPGAGKSVRLKQIVGEIINNRDIKHVPLYIKAKQLAKTIGEISEHKVNTSDFDDAAEILAKAYHASNPIFSRHDFTVESLIEEFKHINESNQKINDSNLILLIDAIDEIQDQDNVEKVLRWIKRFGQNFGLGYSRSIISSRPTHMTQIRNVFASLNQFSMFYQNHTLQKEFSKALIGEWNMSEELSKKVQDYIQEDGIFQHINTPLLIGWLCRFIRDRKEIGDLGNSYDFYELILDQAIRNKRFELKVSFTEQQFESIRTIRNLIAFIGLLNLDKNSQLGRIDLSMKETRHNLLAIRKEKDSLTPGLEKFTDEEMHRMFFEDMSLIFVSGHGEVEWTHEHLKEYAAALFATKGLESGHKMVGFLQSLSNNYEVAGVDLNEIVNQRIMPKRAYFRDAVIHKTSSELVSEIWSESSAVSPIVSKLRHLRNNIMHFEDSVTASEYADLLRSPLVSDEFPKEAKEYLQLIVNDFSKRDLNWIVQAEKRPNKAHAELLTGGVIPILAQKILNEDERMALFRPLIPSDSVFEFNSFSFDEIKGLYFERFLKSEIDASLPSMQVLLAGEFRNQSTIIEKNNLKLSPEYYRRLHEKYTLSSKKFVENSTSEKYLFNTFNEMVQPNSDNPLEGPLMYQLKNANLEKDSKRVYEVLKNLKPLIMEKFEIKKLEYVELLTATVETYSANQSEDEGILCAWCYTQLASIANKNNNFDQAEEFLSFAIDIERKFGFRSDEAGSLRFYSDIYAKKKSMEMAGIFARKALTIYHEIKDTKGQSRTLRQLGLLAKQQEKFAEAEDFYNQALEIDRETEDRKGETMILYRLGLLAKQQEKFAEAEDFYNQALEIDRELGNKNSESAMLYCLGDLCRQQEKFAEAEDFYNQALAIDRETGDKKGESLLLVDSGDLAKQQEKFTQAEDFYNQALEIERVLRNKKRESVILYRLGLLAKQQEKFAEAEDFYNQALAIDRETGDKKSESGILYRLGLLAKQQEKFAEAEDFYNQALAIDRETGDKKSESEVLYKLGLLANQQAKFAEAEDFYNQALAIDRETGDKKSESGILYGLGLLAKQQEKFAEAEDFYNQALAIDRETGDKKSESEVLYKLGLLAKQQEKFTEAEDFYNQALAIDRETGDKVGEGFILRQLGRLGEQIGNFDDAYGLFSRSLEVYQSINDQYKEPQLHINLGDVSAEYLNMRISRSHYKKSIHIWKSKNDLPQLSVAYNRLADLYLKTHQFDEALEVTELSRKLDVETGDKRGLLINDYFTGEAWLGKKAYIEAKACFKKGYHDAMKNDYFLLQATFAECMVNTLREEGLTIESQQWDERSRKIIKRQNLLKLTSGNSRFNSKAIRMLKEKHAPNLGKTSGHSGTFSEDSDSTSKSGVDSIGEMVFSGERKDKAYGSWVDEVGDVQKEELVSTSLALSLKQLLEKRASIHLDLSRMNFFASKDQIYDLLQPYIYSTNAHVKQPIHLVMLLEGDDPIEYHIIDGVKRFHILISALIGAFNKSHKDIPKSYSQILYQNNDQNGTVVDLLNNNEASWEDLNSFVSNVSLALETIIEEGHAVDDIIERISTGLIRATLFTAEKAH